MSTIVVLGGGVALVVLVLFWSGRYGGRGRAAGTSLLRGPHSHTDARGRPKRGYPSREGAEAQARRLMSRDGVRMDVYRCPTCAQWHLGHSG